MALKLMLRSWKTLPSKAVVARCASGGVPELYHEDRTVIGKREVVGFGMNGQATYADKHDFPFPAIRWQEEDSTIKAIREKEKGDWRKLTICEKKALYRFNFRQTIAEHTAWTGEAKSVVGWGLISIALSLWCWVIVRRLFTPPLPETLNLENRQAQLLRMLDSNMYPVTGISREWDHVNRRWKSS